MDVVRAAGACLFVCTPLLNATPRLDLPVGRVCSSAARVAAGAPPCNPNLRTKLTQLCLDKSVERSHRGPGGSRRPGTRGGAPRRQGPSGEGARARAPPARGAPPRRTQRAGRPGPRRSQAAAGEPEPEPEPRAGAGARTLNPSPAPRPEPGGASLAVARWARQGVVEDKDNRRFAGSSAAASTSMRALSRFQLGEAGAIWSFLAGERHPAAAPEN